MECCQYVKPCHRVLALFRVLCIQSASCSYFAFSSIKTFTFQLLWHVCFWVLILLWTCSGGAKPVAVPLKQLWWGKPCSCSLAVFRQHKSSSRPSTLLHYCGHPPFLFRRCKPCGLPLILFQQHMSCECPLNLLRCCKPRGHPLNLLQRQMSCGCPVSTAQAQQPPCDSCGRPPNMLWRRISCGCHLNLQALRLLLDLAPATQILPLPSSGLRWSVFNLGFDLVFSFMFSLCPFVHVCCAYLVRFLCSSVLVHLIPCIIQSASSCLFLASCFFHLCWFFGFVTCNCCLFIVSVKIN